MKKIPTLFMRNYITDKLVRNEITSGCEWVLTGEGQATRKFDGMCCLVRDGKLYKRYELKEGKDKPENFEPVCEVDPITKKQQGWLPVSKWPTTKSEDMYFRGTFEEKEKPFEDGTYELCGPEINKNPEGFTQHVLIRHKKEILNAPRTFDKLKEFFQQINIEGIVWYHPDGRMVKIKAKDFGLKRSIIQPPLIK